MLIFLFFTSANCAVLHDPTQPGFLATVVASQQAKPELTAIYVESDRKLAVLNGKILTEGAEFDGYKLLSIQYNSVNLRGVNGDITLYLFNQSIIHNETKG